MSENGERPEMCPELGGLHKDFDDHVMAEAKWQEKLWVANKKLRSEVAELNTSINSNKIHLAEIQKDIAGVVLAWEGLQGALTFFSAVGKLAKWVTGMTVFFGGIYYFLKGGVPPKG